MYKTEKCVHTPNKQKPISSAMKEQRRIQFDWSVDKMKRALMTVTAGCLLIFYLLLGNVSQVRAEENQREISEAVLRLHVRANSDSEKDQEVKMSVKEAVVKEASRFENEMYDKPSAKAAMIRHTAALKAAAENVLETYQEDYEVNIKIDREWFPRKTYGDISLPEGEYDAVVVELGSARGQNWWCVLFPKLCFIEPVFGYVPETSKETLKALLSDEAYASIENKEPKARLKIVEWLQNIW